MQIKRFQAQTMTEALRMVKKEFGPDAVILSAQNAKSTPGLLGRLKKTGVEVTAATDNWPGSSTRSVSIRLDEAAMPNQGKARSQGGGAASPRTGGLPGKIKRIHPFRRFQGGKKKESAPRNTAPPSPPIGANVYSGAEDLALAGLRRQLLRQGVDEEIVSPLLQGVKKRAPHSARGDMEGFKPFLVDILRDMGLKTGCEEAPGSGQELMVLLGSAGVGKTTTIAKMAADRALRMKQRVGVISLDNDRIGALHQSRAYARIIGVPMEVAGSRDELGEALRRMKDREVIFIDTPGVSPLDEEKIRKLKECFDPDRPCKVHLLLSAGSKDRDMTITVERMKCFPIDGLIFTKLDESIGFGNLLNLMVQTGLPVAYLTDGPDVSKNLEVASLEGLTDVIVTPTSRRRPISIRGRKEESLPREAPAAPPGPAAPAVDDNFVANRNSDIFHYPSCKWTRMIKEENIIKFKDSRAALHQNYKPCRYCKPVDPEQNASWRRPLSKRKVAVG